MNAVENAVEAPQQELVAAHVPSDVTRLRHDLLVRWCCDKAFLGFFKIPFVLERQGLAQTVL